MRADYIQPAQAVELVPAFVVPRSVASSAQPPATCFVNPDGSVATGFTTRRRLYPDPSIGVKAEDPRTVAMRQTSAAMMAIMEEDLPTPRLDEGNEAKGSTTPIPPGAKFCPMTGVELVPISQHFKEAQNASPRAPALVHEDKEVETQAAAREQQISRELSEALKLANLSQLEPPIAALGIEGLDELRGYSAEELEAMLARDASYNLKAVQRSKLAALLARAPASNQAEAPWSDVATWFSPGGTLHHGERALARSNEGMNEGSSGEPVVQIV